MALSSPQRAVRATVVLFTLALAGCSHIATTRNGFLGNYAELKPDAKDPRRLVFVDPEWKQADYATVLIEPTVVRLSPKDEKRITAAESTELAAWCDAALRQAFGTDYRLVTVPEAQTLRIRTAVTGIDTSSPALNAVTGLLLWPLDAGGVGLEFDVLDAARGERLAALVGSSKGTPLQVVSSFSRFGHAHRGIEHWVAELLKIVRPRAAPAPAK